MHLHETSRFANLDSSFSAALRVQPVPPQPPKNSALGPAASGRKTGLVPPVHGPGASPKILLQVSPAAYRGKDRDHAEKAEAKCSELSEPQGNPVSAALSFERTGGGAGVMPRADGIGCEVASPAEQRRWHHRERELIKGSLARVSPEEVSIAGGGVDSDTLSDKDELATVREIGALGDKGWRPSKQPAKTSGTDVNSSWIGLGLPSKSASDCPAGAIPAHSHQVSSDRAVPPVSGKLSEQAGKWPSAAKSVKYPEDSLESFLGGAR